jgi:hypothetical protein
MALVPLAHLYLMAYLARRPNTWLLRLAFAPLALYSTVRTAYLYHCIAPTLGAYNFGIGTY